MTKYGTAALKKFKKYYIEYGSAAKAMEKVNPRLSKRSCEVMGGLMLKRIDLSDIMEAQGITNESLMKTLGDGLKAERPLIVKEQHVDDIPDHKTRHKFLETGLKLKGYLQTGQTVIDNRKLVVALPREGAEIGEVVSINAESNGKKP